MPIPTPRPNEEEKKFVSRCISELHKIDPSREQKQVIAICYSQWKKSKHVEETVEEAKINWYINQVEEALRVEEAKKNPVVNPEDEAKKKELIDWVSKHE